MLPRFSPPVNQFRLPPRLLCRGKHGARGRWRTDVHAARVYLFGPAAESALPPRRTGTAQRVASWLESARTPDGAVLAGLAFRTAAAARACGMSARAFRMALAALRKSGTIAVQPAGHLGLRVRIVRRLPRSCPHTRMYNPGTEPTTPLLPLARQQRAGARSPHRGRPMPDLFGHPDPTRSDPTTRRAVFQALAVLRRKHRMGPQAARDAAAATLADLDRARAAGRPVANLHALARVLLAHHAQQQAVARHDAQHGAVKAQERAERRRARPGGNGPPMQRLAALLAAGVPYDDAVQKVENTR